MKVARWFARFFATTPEPDRHAGGPGQLPRRTDRGGVGRGAGLEADAGPLRDRDAAGGLSSEGFVIAMRLFDGALRDTRSDAAARLGADGRGDPGGLSRTPGSSRHCSIGAGLAGDGAPVGDAAGAGGRVSEGAAVNDDPLVLLAVGISVLANLVIAGYAGTGIWVAPKFDAAAPSVGLRLTKLSALIFFLTCAMTHIEMASHVYYDRPEWMLSLHFVVIHSVQALAAPTFLVLATAYMSIRIFNRELYEGMLARRIVEVRDEVLRLRRESERDQVDERIDTVMAQGDSLSRSVWDALGRQE